MEYTAALAATYDNSRRAEQAVLDLFDRRFNFRQGVPFLDFGCGTGNYLQAIAARFSAHGSGCEPSEAMRTLASRKNPRCDIRSGDHRGTGFPDGTFGLVFMTDVIHQVPDLDSLFANVFASLKDGGLVAILTESRTQIGRRWYNRYFPSLCRKELDRYPDIPVIEKIARAAGFAVLERNTLIGDPVHVVDDFFVAAVREKNRSAFGILDENEHRQGLLAIEKESGKAVFSDGHGETVVWLKKEHV